ncbi:MAG: hypothetical protein JWO89_713 [Verrucomicrobiaceae bacterium]|nr:hypothetical protein [Verrucomicrobiaceae bacterium]
MEKFGKGGMTSVPEVTGTGMPEAAGAGAPLVAAVAAAGEVVKPCTPHTPRTIAASSIIMRAQRIDSATVGAALLSELRMAFGSAITLKQRHPMIGSSTNSVNTAQKLP